METTLIDFLFTHWWILIILAVFLGTAWDSWLKYRRHQAALEVLKSYAESGKEPPAELVKALNKGTMAEDLGLDMGTGEADEMGGPATTAFLVILLGGLASIFAYATYIGWLDLGEEGYFVAAILGVIAFAFLISGFFRSK